MGGMASLRPPQMSKLILTIKFDNFFYNFR